MGKLQQYKDRWADEPGETQRERAARESAVRNVESTLHAKGMQFIEGERVDIARVGDAVARSTADVESAATAILKAMRKRIVNTEEIADQLVTLKRTAARNRKVIGELAPRQEANERNAEDPVAYMERFYERYSGSNAEPILPSPVDSLPGFRTDSERATQMQEDQEKRRRAAGRVRTLEERAAGSGTAKNRARL